jgi:MHS family proline/betaine transporter-like MFS transporter
MPLGGYIGDRIGLHRLMVLGLMGYVLLTYPMMSLMGNGLAIAGVAYLVIMLNTVATQVSCYTLLPMLFEQEHRYTGVATGFNLGVILAGGTAPFVAMWMVEKTGNILAPAYFVIVSAAIGLVAIATVSRRLRASYRLAA